MDPSSIAAAFVASQASQLQTVVAAKMLKMNADMASSAAQLLDAASQNLNRLANVAAGVGGNLDITA
ncbi:putative motility protein [Rhodoplanes sp. Z2-YC6860]|uniref:putative motility protein n=1 Tax=Rhodoplanes sp. Z2-YC6860 TaxID=674703 RepID=UPI00082F7CAC|nr:putative motility protein [Rhodoplanes sp. Z2-YC6860]